MAIKIQINADQIAAQFKGIQQQIAQEIKAGVLELATATEAHISGQVRTELKSKRQKQYLDGLKIESISDNVHVISLDESAFWIEEGLPENFDMKPGLLKGGKHPGKYRVVPFEHSDSKLGANPSEKEVDTHQKAQALIGQIKGALKQKNIPFKAIERNPNGSPKLGRLHTLNIASDIPGKGNTPQLHGLTVYQSKTKSGGVRKDVMTFRTVSSGPASEGKFIHPGMVAKRYFEQAEQWALSEWENKILPEILKKYK